jgi:predicted DNA-binding transcriptional regulator YafY
LDFLEVHLHFYRGMVKAYEHRQNDIQDEIIGDVRQVVRRVSNPFWLVREVLRYGRDCAVISPDNVCEAVKKELLEMCRRYNLTL